MGETCAIALVVWGYRGVDRDDRGRGISALDVTRQGTYSIADSAMIFHTGRKSQVLQVSRIRSKGDQDCFDEYPFSG